MENLFSDLISAMNRQQQQGQTGAGPSTSSPIQPASVPAPLPVDETDDEDDSVTRPIGAESDSDERKILFPTQFPRSLSDETAGYVGGIAMNAFPQCS